MGANHSSEVDGSQNYKENVGDVKSNDGDKIRYDIAVKNNGESTEDVLDDPKHFSKYISPSQFQLDDLPEPVRTEEIFHFVNRVAGIMVRLCVSVTSKQRCGKFILPPASRPGYKRYASGWVCLSSGKNEGSIRVITARHVVYNDREAKNTEVTFFFDSPDQTEKEVAQGVCISIAKDNRDFVILECETKDESLKRRLADVLMTLSETNLTFKSISTKHDCRKDRNFTVLFISHPHGGSKLYSFGSCVDIDENDTEFDMRTGEKIRAKCVYKYDVSTYPGSSGAPVILIGEPGVSYFWTPHCYKDDQGFGVSAKGLVTWTPMSIDNTTLKLAE